jgi:putative FmdB family regulatory protein
MKKAVARPHGGTIFSAVQVPPERLMPVYEYLCEGCGPFTLMRSMSEYELPADCPLCQASAPRVMLTAPYCSTASPQTRLAGAASERSAEGRSSAGDAHGAACSCCTTSRFSLAAKRGKGKASASVARG